MLKRILNFSLLFFGLLLTTSSIFAQTTYNLVLEESEILIDGTSNRTPEFTCESTEISGYVIMNDEATVEDPGIEEVQITVKTATIISNKSLIMDRLTRNAFESGKFPDIVFEMISAEVTSSDAGAGTFELQTTGNLSMHGVTKEIDMVVNGTLLDGGKVRFEGRHEMKMTTYEMDPPTAMFGALRTRDDVVVRFNVVMAK